MNDEMIKRWNEKITKKDTVYNLGDFSWAHSNLVMKELLLKLNYKEFHLILGNHERKMKNKERELFTSISFFKEIKLYKQNIVMCHYPLNAWYKDHYGTWDLHGHSHGKNSNTLENQLDVGVDCHNFYPLDYEEIKEIIEKMK